MQDSSLFILTLSVPVDSKKSPLSTMANSYYSYYWWTNNREDWLRVSLIAAPLMIIFGLVLISYRLCGRRASYIYKPCAHTQMTKTSQCHSSVYQPVYKATTCAINDTNYNGVTTEHELSPQDSSVVGRDTETGTIANISYRMSQSTANMANSYFFMYGKQLTRIFVFLSAE